MINLYNGNCLDVMADIPDKSIDAIICDPPYAVTGAHWDTLVPIEPMWEQLNRIIKPKGNIILHCQQPFTTDLINGNRKHFKHATVWHKVHTSNFLASKYMRLTAHEDILLFCDGAGTYNPQKKKRNKSRIVRSGGTGCGASYNNAPKSITYRSTERFPTSLIEYPSPHPTQRHHGHEKPVELMEYLIKTYSNVGDTVLDFTMGSGTTGVAAVRCERSFIGIELDKDYFKICEERIYGADAEEKHVAGLLEF